MADNVEGQNIDTLYIDVSAKTQKGNADIDKLFESLEKLQPVLESINDSIKGFQKYVDSIDTSKIQKAVDNAKKLASEDETPEQRKKRFLKILKTPQRRVGLQGITVTDYRDELSKRPKAEYPTQDYSYDPAIAKANAKRGKKIEDEFNKPVKETKEATVEYEKLSDVLKEIGGAAQKISSKNVMGKSLTETYRIVNGNLITTIKAIDGEVREIDEKTVQIAKNSKKASKAWSSIGHVLKYRAISTAINLISKGLNDGIKNVALFDDKFNATMSNIQSSSNRLTNQVGSFAATFIENYEPLIVGVLDGMSNIMDYFTQVMAVVNGETQYRRAVKNAEDFAKGMRKAYSGIGIDELNIFGERQQEKFEFADVSKFAKETAGIVTTVASLAALSGITIKLAQPLSNLFSSEKIKGFAENLGNVKTNLKEISGTTKGVVSGIALLAGGFAIATQSGKKLAESLSSDNKSGVGGALFGLVGGVAAGAAGGYLVGGPIGAVIGGLAGVIEYIGGFIAESEKLARSNAISEFFSNAGESIESVQAKLDVFYKSLGSDVAREYTEKLVTLRDNVSDANLDLESFFNQLSVSDNIDLSDFDKLAEKFDKLAESAKELNNWNRDNFFKVLTANMSALPADKIYLVTGLLESMQESTKKLNEKIDDSLKNAKDIIANAKEKGGFTADDYQKLQEYSKIISSNSMSLETFKAKEALSGINFGSTEEEIKNNIEKLQNQIDSEISAIQDAFAQYRMIEESLYTGGITSYKEYQKNIDALNQVEKYVIDAMRQELADTLETGMLSYVDSWIKKIQDETGKTISRSELLKNLQTYSGFNRLDDFLTHFGMGKGQYNYNNRDFDLESAMGGYFGVSGVADMVAEIVGLQAEQLQTSQDEAWNRMIDSQRQSETIMKEQLDMQEKALEEQRRGNSLMQRLVDYGPPQTTVSIDDETIYKSAAKGAAKSGLRLNGANRDVY